MYSNQTKRQPTRTRALQITPAPTVFVLRDLLFALGQLHVFGIAP